MNRSVSAAVTLAIVFTGAAVASADPIIIVTEDRSVEASELPGLLSSMAIRSDTLSVTGPPVNFVQGISTASLTSTFANPLRWSASGMASVSLSPINEAASVSGEATSSFGVSFDVVPPCAPAPMVSRRLVLLNEDPPRSSAVRSRDTAFDAAYADRSAAA